MALILFACNFHVRLFVIDGFGREIKIRVENVMVFVKIKCF